MTVPLVILGVLSVVGGWVELPDGWLWGGAFTRWLAPVLGTFHTEAARGAATSAIGWVALAATFIGFALAYILYIQTPALPGRIAASASALYQVLVRKYYVDEFYNAVFGRFLFWGSENVLTAASTTALSTASSTAPAPASRVPARPRGARRPATFRCTRLSTWWARWESSPTTFTW